MECKPVLKNPNGIRCFDSLILDYLLDDLIQTFFSKIYSVPNKMTTPNQMCSIHIPKNKQEFYLLK